MPGMCRVKSLHGEKASVGEEEREAEEAESRGQRPLFGCKHQSAVCVSLPELHMLSFSVCPENCDK